MPFRRGPVILLLLALVLIPGAPLLPAAAPVTLRVMSFNIHHGEGIDGKLDLERIARVIRDARADLVGLQEVDRGVERTQRRDLPAELARLTGLTVRFDRNIAHQGGDYGNATLTRFPIRQARNIPLKSFNSGEQRGVQELVLEVHGRTVLFYNTHLDARRDPVEREHSATELKALLAAAGSRPALVVGDFNATPDRPSVGVLRDVLADAWTTLHTTPGFTSPAGKPTRRIDYIFHTPGAFQPVDMEVIVTNASDHLPIVATLRLN